MHAGTTERRALRVGCGIAALTSGPYFAWVAGSSFSWGVPLVGSEVYFLLLLLVVAGSGLLAVLGAARLLARRERGGGSALLTGAGSCLLLVLASFHLSWEVRAWGFERFTRRAEPLVAALHAYEAAHGAPPDRLDDLVPGFLPRIPGTGVGSSPEYHYRRAGTEAGHWEGNPWLLELDVGTGVLNWDALVYLPLQNYPERGWGGRLERIGAWAYVWE